MENRNVEKALFGILPQLEHEELIFIKNLVQDFDESQLQQFAMTYRSRRKDPQTILLTTLIGFLGIAGIQRFLTDQIALGIIYLLTGGLCGIGTIVDLITYKKIALEYNQKQAQEIVLTLSAMKSY